MNNLTSSVLLLVLALTLLWLAVTGKLNRVTDAYDVLSGKASARSATAMLPTLGGDQQSLPQVSMRSAFAPLNARSVQVPAV